MSVVGDLSIEDLRVIVRRLPKSRDNTPVAPGMFLVSTYYREIQGEREVAAVSDCGWRFRGSCWYHADDGCRPCYSTLEAAEAAVRQAYPAVDA